MPNNILKLWKSFESDDPLNPLFEAGPVLMHSIDCNGYLLKVSRFWAAKLGYREDEMVGRKSTEFLSEESQQYAMNVALPMFYEEGSLHNVAYEFVRKDGKILPVLMSAMAEYDADGRFVRSLAIMFDNTEATRVAQELRQQLRMEAIGGLVGGVAHDFNNLLSVVQGNLEFLKQDPDDLDRKEFIDSALKATQRGAALTQQLLTYGRKANLSPSKVSVRDVLVSANRIVGRLFPANIKLETAAADDLADIHVDPALLETAVLNILNNARDAMPKGGVLTMEARNVVIDEAFVETRNEEISAGHYVMLAISDTGVGMDNETLSQVFEPFFSTKGVGKGTGLGLSMVFGFVRQSNGALRAYSEVGVGTTFRMYFPIDDVEGDAPTQVFNDPADHLSGKTILLAEDEDSVRKIMVRQLAQSNVRVVEAATGDAAFQKLERGFRPDLLITDIVMPGTLQGPELVRKARAMYPGIKIMFISGYPNEAAIHGNGIQREDRYLIKPVSRNELRRTVEELIGKSETAAKG